MNSLSPAIKPKDPFAIVLVSNGPGELMTWVRPVAEKLYKKLCISKDNEHSNLILRLVLVPCPNATGKEAEAAKKWNLFNLISPSETFWNLLINPKNYGNWPAKGLVIFLGGDQFWSVLLSRRLGYKHLTYAEWIARWPQWNDRIAAMSIDVKNKIPKKYRKRCKVVGDLMADLPILYKDKSPLPNGQWIAILPGSKKAKLKVGLPYFLEVADRLKSMNSELKFLLPIAETTNINEFYKYLSHKNKIAKKYKSGIKNIEPKTSNTLSKLITVKGTEIYLQEEQPSYNYISQCSLALTTVGANTAELGALSVPMIVVVPTQHIAAMNAWDGLVGVIARIPGLNWLFGILLSIWRLRFSKSPFLAWPNINAGRLIVPERIGKFEPKDIAEEANQWLSSPSNLLIQKNELQLLRGPKGASEALTKEIIDLIDIVD